MLPVVWEARSSRGEHQSLGGSGGRLGEEDTNPREDLLVLPSNLTLKILRLDFDTLEARLERVSGLLSELSGDVVGPESGS